MAAGTIGNLSISELAELLGTSTSALRYYEREGLMLPERIESNGYRSYSFNAAVEFTDIMIYRNLGVPVKEIRRLMDAPIEETDTALLAAEEDLIAQLARIERGLRTIAGRRNMIRRYRLAIAEGPHLVRRPGVERLFPFRISDPSDLIEYVSDPRRIRYTALFPSACDGTSFDDCSAVPLTESAPVWECPSDGLWLECMMETGYNATDANDLSLLVGHVEDLGYRPGCAVAEYLTFNTGSDGARHDYYLTWIEALPLR